MTKDIIELIAPSIDMPAVYKALVGLGCRIKKDRDQSIIQLPQGTTRVPMTGFIVNERFKITFPDGVVIYEQFNRMLGSDGQSLLHVPMKLVEPYISKEEDSKERSEEVTKEKQD